VKDHRIYILAALMFVAPLSASPASLTQWTLHSPQEVQRALAGRGFNPGPIDGQWGKKSINALKAFQRANGLAATGVFDSSAAEVLFPAEKKPTSAASTDSTATAILSTNKVEPVQVDSQPRAEKTTITDAGKQTVEKEIPKKSALPKMQVIVEKTPTPGEGNEIKTSRAVEPELPPALEAQVSSVRGWLLYGAISSFGVLALAAVFRRRRRSSTPMEPVLAGSARDENRPAEVDDGAWQRYVPAEVSVKSISPPLRADAGPIGSVERQFVTIAPVSNGQAKLLAGEVGIGAPVTEGARNQDEIAEVSTEVPDYRVTLAAHNKSVADFVANNRVIDGGVAEAANVENSQVPHSPLPTPVERIDGHSARTAEEIPADAAPGKSFSCSGSTRVDQPIGNGAFGQKPFFGTARRPDGSGPLSLVVGGRNNESLPRSNSDCWVPPGTRVSVSGISFDAGLVYFGGYLGKQGASHESENCLIDPRLKVGSRGDPQGTTMGYWPSYSRITPEARRSYLEWLAGGRDQPETYIGYVFLYFYGLERRLMLESGQGDGHIVSTEVERLLSVYGGNNSFHRYAQELLSAYEMKVGPSLDGRVPDVDGAGYEVPMPIKLALGVRVRDGKPFEPDLLMKFALSHPETKVRTPARRAPELLRELFAEELIARYPTGLTIKAGQFKKLKMTYRACSGSFTLDVAASDGTIPDISDRAEPITTARTIFETCSDKLDEYSRALGRSPGLQPTLNIAAKLPDALRSKIAERLPGNPLATLAQLAETARPVSLGNLLEISSIDPGISIGKTKLRELSQLLAAFGFGNTADPAYGLRLPVAADPVVLFPISGSAPDATEAYRSAQLSSMLGMMIGHTDGDFAHSERLALENQITENPHLSQDEKARLRAEMAISEMNPAGLEEWSKRLKDLSAPTRNAVAAELVVIAAADGKLHPAEVKKLEGLFKRMGLDPQSLYSLLHESGSKRQSYDDLPLVIPAAEAPNAIPIPRPPVTSTSSIDVNKLMAIRHETIATTIILEGILGDVEEPTEIVMPEPELIEDGGVFDGLELRYNALVAELRSQPEWSREDFETLVKNASLMPNAALRAINEWSVERFDELFIEGEDPLTINAYILPTDSTLSAGIAERMTT
jgi:tellurite resistance protein